MHTSFSHRPSRDLGFLPSGSTHRARGSEHLPVAQSDVLDTVTIRGLLAEAAAAHFNPPLSPQQKRSNVCGDAAARAGSARFSKPLIPSPGFRTENWIGKCHGGLFQVTGRVGEKHSHLKARKTKWPGAVRLHLESVSPADQAARAFAVQPSAFCHLRDQSGLCKALSLWALWYPLVMSLLLPNSGQDQGRAVGCAPSHVLDSGLAATRAAALRSSSVPGSVARGSLGRTRSCWASIDTVRKGKVL